MIDYKFYLPFIHNFLIASKQNSPINYRNVYYNIARAQRAVLDVLDNHLLT